MLFWPPFKRSILIFANSASSVWSSKHIYIYVGQVYGLVWCISRSKSLKCCNKVKQTNLFVFSSCIVDCQNSTRSQKCNFQEVSSTTGSQDTKRMLSENHAGKVAALNSKVCRRQGYTLQGLVLTTSPLKRLHKETDCKVYSLILFTFETNFTGI